MKIIDSIKDNPQNYFMFNAATQQYDLENLDTSATYKSLKKKVFGGEAELIVQAEKIQILWNDDLVAEAELVADVWHNSAWQSQTFSFQDANIKKITSEKVLKHFEEVVGQSGQNTYSGTIPADSSNVRLYSPVDNKWIEPYVSPTGSWIGVFPQTTSSDTQLKTINGVQGSRYQSGTLGPVLSGSFVAQTGMEICSDNAQGDILNADSEVCGFINYDTGEYEFTFSNSTNAVPIIKYYGYIASNIILFYDAFVDKDCTPYFRAFEIKDIPALSVTDAVFGMDFHWGFGKVKQAFYLDVPGYLCRLRWRARVKDSAVAWTDNSNPRLPVYHRGLSYNISDYPGNVSHVSSPDAEAGWTQHQWTFEPDGYNCPVEDERTPFERFEESAGLFVDPYLRIDEDGSYIYVYCDGFIIVFDKTGTYPGPFVMNPGMTYGYLETFQVVYGGTYIDFIDPNFIAEVIEDTPNRVVIRTVGIPHDTTQYLSNSGIVESIFCIYPDRYFVEKTWIVNGSITNTGFGPTAVLVTGVAGETANNVYENSGSESDAADATNYDNANYLAVLSDEFNVQFITLSMYGFDSVIHQYNDQDGVLGASGDGTTETAGTKYYSYCMIVDFAVREGSAKLYDSTDRLAMGKQYKDLKILKSGVNQGSVVLDDASSQYLQWQGTH